MPFQYVLADLLASTDGAIGALLLDDTGETVDLACSELSPGDVQLMGAYLGIYLRDAGRIVQGSSLGSPKLLHIERERLQVQLATLSDGYFLALVQRRPAPVAPARSQLLRAAEQLEAEVFSG